MTDRVTIISTCEFRRREQDPNSKNYEPMSRRLVYSIRTNGGKYRDAPIIMYHSQGSSPSEETTRWLERHGCRVVEGGKDLIPREPVGNKIDACNCPISSEYGLWMDSDMYLLDTQAFEDLIDKEVDIAATGSEYGYHRWGRLSDGPTWEKLYRLSGVSPPTETFSGGLDGEPVHFYFNSAIVFFRAGINFPETWREMARKVRFSGIENVQHNFTQTSLTLAALKVGRRFEQLPQSYNAYFALEKEASLGRAVLHYQDNVIDFDSRVKWNV